VVCCGPLHPSHLPTFHVVAIINTDINASSQERHFFVTADDPEKAIGKALGQVQTNPDLHIPFISAFETVELAPDILQGAGTILGSQYFKAIVAASDTATPTPPPVDAPAADPVAAPVDPAAAQAAPIADAPAAS
jgi:hypothetical protein